MKCVRQRIIFILSSDIWQEYKWQITQMLYVVNNGSIDG